MEIPGCASSINPKVEPCEDEEPPLPPPFEASSDEWEVTPLSGDNPFFTSVMCKSQVQNPFQLVVHVHIPILLFPIGMHTRTHASSSLGVRA